MPIISLRIRPEQRAALDEALAASGLDEQAFVERAVRSLAARLGVEYPPLPTPTVHSIEKPKPEHPGQGVGVGYPARAKLGLHPMDYDVPAGDLLLVCPTCGRTFHSDTTMAVFCSDLCKIAMRNKRQYLRRKKLKS